MLKKQQIGRQIQEMNLAIERTKAAKQSLSDDLEGVERQWTAILEAEIDAVVLPPLNNDAQEDTRAYPFEKAKSLGAVGRLVVSPDNYP